MKKIWIISILILISGCTFKKEKTEEKIEITGYYQLVSAFKYENSSVISYNIGENVEKFSLMITPNKIILHRPIWENIAKESFEYQIVDNEIIIDGTNYNGLSTYTYKIIKSPIKDNIILYEDQKIGETFYKIRKEYEKIKEQEYMKKMGGTDEE